VGSLQDHTEGTYAENCYIKMPCIKLVENLEQECDKSWRIDDKLTKLLPETPPNF